MRTLDQAGNLSGKKVLVRNDFNITIDENGKVLGDFRIRASLPTIQFLLKNKAKIILMAHFGRPEGQIVESMSLAPIAKILSDYLGISIKKAPDCIGYEVEKLVNKMKEGEVLLLENLRFHAGEEANDEEFAKSLAKLGELYIDDAFGASHRAHASIVGITKYLPSYAGLLLQKEVETLSRVLEKPERPLTVVIGGAKISTKIKLIREYLKRAEHIILGGALANTVLHAQGLAIGKSLIETEAVDDVKKLEITDIKLHLPVDVVVSTDKTGKAENRVSAVGKIEPDELILDIGPETEKIFDSVIHASRMVIWNGPMGLFEVDAFSHGTIAMAESVSSCPCFSIVGGGEITSFLEETGMIDKFSHVSTGGGAMMEFLAGDKLPGIEALE